MKKKRALCLAFFAALFSAVASSFGDSIRVEARRGRRSCGEESVFRVSLLDDRGILKTNGEGRVSLDNFGPKTNFSERVDFAVENPRIFRGTLKEPGFLRLTVDVKGASRDPAGKPCIFSVPYENEKIEQGAPEPTDFDAFWRDSLAELEAKVPLDARITEETSKSSDSWTMYSVSFASLGRRIYGWLSIPRGKGPWPVQVEIPGAGCGMYSMLMEGAPDRVKMMLTVFPFEPSLDMKENARHFDELNADLKKQYGVPRYPFAGVDISREEYFYRPVVVGAVRAVRWLAARTEVDRTRFAYYGTSQGGGCGFYLLALAPDVFTEGRIIVPALTDTLGGLKGREGGWPHYDQEWFLAEPQARDARICKIMPYFDGCNFAARVKCPVTVVVGLADWICPPAAVCAAYNRISAEGRRLVMAYGGSHWTADHIASEEEEMERKATTALRAEGASRPGTFGALIDPEDTDYVRRKFREDVTEPGSGLGIAELTDGSFELAKKSFDEGGNWQVAKAMAFAWICENMGVSASEHDIFPAISCYRRLPRPLGKAVQWRDAEVNRQLLVKETLAVRKGLESGRFAMWKDFDHSVPAWDELLAGGWPMIESRLNECDKGTPYYKALRITLKGCYTALERFAAAAREAAAKASSPEKRARLEREAVAFENIRRAPPKTVYEAMVFQWSYFFLSEHVDNLQVRALGALDVLYTPFYRADLAAGRVTPESFKRDLAHFWWQWGSVDNYWGQPVALGGTKADGATEFNEVSDLILDVHDELALPTPKMLVKIAVNTPNPVFDRMLAMAARNRSITFDGEESIYRSLKSWRNCTDEECRTSDLNGCYEFYVHAAQNVTQSSHISFLQPVADLLMRAKAGEFAAADYDAFFAAYIAELKNNTLECCDLTDAWEKYLGDINPGNVYSLASASAVRNGKDAFCNGLKYNDTGLLSVGLGTAVDALLAVKEIVYERKEMSLPALGALMAANWEGNEVLHRRMLRSKRKWGNNEPEANRTGAEIVRNISSWVNGRPNSRGGIWGFSGHPARQFIVLMKYTGATPDGRLAGEESSKNLSPTMGADTEGVTALIDTLSNLKPEDLPLNFPLDVQLHPSAVHGSRGIAGMRTLARVYFANGGQTLQFNVFSTEQLKDAQKHPWKYANLQVRVCGWNVRWNDLSKTEQDKYIARAENIAGPVPAAMASEPVDCRGRPWRLPASAQFDGRVLKIVIPEGSKDSGLALMPIDLKPFKDGEVRISVMAKGKGVSNPKESWMGSKVMLKYRDGRSGKQYFPQAKVPRGDFAGEYAFVWPLYGAETEDAFLSLGLENASGEIEFDLSSLKVEACVGETIKNPDYKVKYPDRVAHRRQLRGCMVHPDVRERDIADLAAWGAKLFRYQILPIGSFTLKGANEDEKIACFERNVDARVDFIARSVLPWARKYGLSVIVDLHMYPEETIFTSVKSRDAFVVAWGRMAERLKGNADVIYGYDLMNEPVRYENSEWGYFGLQELCANAIRRIDPDTTIIVAGCSGDAPSSFLSLDALRMDNVIYTVHVYDPLEYTHQFVCPDIHPERAKKTALPDDIEKYLRDTLVPVKRFQERHGCRILVGEFSAALWAERSDEYLDACIKIFNEYGWDWTYHAFRESTLWSVEHEAASPTSPRLKSDDTSRKRVLLKGFAAP